MYKTFCIQNILLLLLIPVLFRPAEAAATERLSLNGAWQFKQSASRSWLPAQVPGTVQTDLLENKQIPDPFLGINEKSVQWIGEKDWEYRKTFTVGEDMLKAAHLHLVFEGLDTYADVFINDYPVMQGDNMFRTWQVDARPYLRKGENTVRIYFHSVFKIDMPKYLQAPFKLQAWPNNDQSDLLLSLYARKAGYNYGWDWGPRLITSGIWRDVYLEYWSDIKIDATQLITRKLETNKASMEARCSILSDTDSDILLTLACEGKETVRKEVKLQKGINTVNVNFDVKKPELWWTNGLGKARLYDFDIVVRSGDKVAKDRVRTGIRTLEVIREKDSSGQSFTVKLNGKAIFIKGANYIPSDNFPNRVSDSRYESTVRSAAAVHMNMLRVWGGGTYEKDIFYDMCDQYGILVWQDMMFACGMFPADEQYLSSVRAEVKDNIRRLRNHPSIALWNGNNENEISYFGWGWRDRYSQEEDRIYQSNLRKLFYDVIPAAIRETDDSRYYHPTSPSTGYNGIGPNMGDVHFWSVWKGGWLEEYTESKNIGRFMSEYGFQSYPEMQTIRKFAEEKDLRLDSEVMLCHQRARNDQTRDPNFGNNMMKMYMEKYFHVPDDFEQFVYMSQLLQAEAVKVGIEAHRRAKPYCMGTLYWQINDCWPVASWSSIDSYGKWKALQYYTKKAYSEVLVSPHANGDTVSFKLISDRMQPMKANLHITTYTLEGQLVFSHNETFRLAENSSEEIVSIPKSKLFGGKAANRIFTHAVVTENNREISSNTYYPVYSNQYTYPEIAPECIVEKAGGGINIKLCSKQLIRGLYLYVDDENSFFEDNFVTLIPGMTQTVFVRTDLSPEEMKTRLKFRSLNEMNESTAASSSR